MDADVILVGTDRTSLLARALSRGGILPRVATAEYPGKGKGLLAHAWSPFTYGRNAVLVSGSDSSGVARAAATLCPRINV